MKIFRINKRFYIRTLYVIVVSGAIFACKRQEILKYAGENFLYFVNKGPHITDHVGLFSGYNADIKFSFLISGFQVDTFQMNRAAINYFFMPLTIQSEGKLTTVNRKIALEIEGDGAAYCVLPHPDSLYIPANSTAYKLNIKIARPPQNDTTVKSITLKLKDNDQFAPEKHKWLQVTYRFGNWFDRPQYYEEYLFGGFSKAKMQAMQAAVYASGPAIWLSDVNAASLNAHLVSLNERKVAFDNFTLDVLYHFIDMKRHTPSGGMRNVYTALLTKILGITKGYLQTMNDAGTPIKDASGALVVIP